MYIRVCTRIHLILGQLFYSQSYIRSLRNHGGIINRTIVQSAAKGIVEFHDKTLLKQNGGHIEFSRKWTESILHRMNMVRYGHEASGTDYFKHFLLSQIY